MKFKLLSVFVLFLLIFFTGCDSKDKKTVTQSKNKELPSFILTSHNGKTINLQAINEGMIFKEYKDKIVLLNFFATWCQPCKAEIPHLNNLKERFKGKLEIISVLVEEKTNEEIEEFIKEHKINYTITNSSENFILAQAIGGVKSIPTMLLFGTKGEVIEKYIGIVPEEMLASDIEKTIEKEK